VKSLPSPGNNSQSFGRLIGNPSEFVAPREDSRLATPAGTFLNNSRTSVNFDMALLKHFKVRENRACWSSGPRCINIFNHTQFRVYDPDNPGSTGNNIVSCYAGPLYSAGFKAARPIA